MKAKAKETIKRLSSVILASLIFSPQSMAKDQVANDVYEQEKPNILFIIADDLNDFIGAMNSDIGVHTPHLDALAQKSTLFTNAHSNAPVCSPSRASLFSGILPHVSGQYGFEHWRQNEVLANSRTIMEQLSLHGYHSAGTGKLTHQQWTKAWDEFGNIPNYGPLAFNGNRTTQHPDMPTPFRDNIGPLDSTFIPLSHVPVVKPDGENPGYSGWYYGGYKEKRPYPYQDENNRAPLPDEENAQWGVNRLKEYAKRPLNKPFFMGIGFIRPHTPLVVPDRFFEIYPIESINLPEFPKDDAADTHFESIFAPKPSIGRKHFDNLIASYPTKEEALKRYYQAYLASVTFMDEQVGIVLDALAASPFADNTLVVFTSDHGYNLGEKDNLFKNNLWERSTRVPLLVFDPKQNKQQVVDEAVSLVDIYPTLIDYAGIENNTRKNDKGKAINGISLKPLVEGKENHDSEYFALTAVRSTKKGKNFSIKTKDWRYIRYSNGKEELYDHRNDEAELTNLAGNKKYQKIKQQLAMKLSQLTKDAI